MINIVPVAAKDFPILSDLAFESKAYWGYDETFMEACRVELTYRETDLLRQGACFRAAKIDNQYEGRLIGFFSLLNLGDEDVELEALFVDPHYIAQGIGARLFNEAVTLATGNGAKTLSVQSDPNAKDFYLSRGMLLTEYTPSESIPGRTLPRLTLRL